MEHLVFKAHFHSPLSGTCINPDAYIEPPRTTLAHARRISACVTSATSQTKYARINTAKFPWSERLGPGILRGYFVCFLTICGLSTPKSPSSWPRPDDHILRLRGSIGQYNSKQLMQIGSFSCLDFRSLSQAYRHSGSDTDDSCLPRATCTSPARVYCYHEAAYYVSLWSSVVVCYLVGIYRSHGIKIDTFLHLSSYPNVDNETGRTTASGCMKELCKQVRAL